MITVQFMKPFYTKVSDTKLRLVFAYQYFAIEKDAELYHFIPIEGKEIIVDSKTMQVENLSEVFVFQRGNRFIRLPLYQLLLVSNIHEHLTPILDNVKGNLDIEPTEEESSINPEVLALIHALEEENLSRLIDTALAERNEALFYDLISQKEKLNEDYAI